MRIALLLLCVAVSGCRARDDASGASTVIHDEQGPALRHVYPGRAADEGLALGAGRPSPVYRLGRDGALTPVGTVDIGDRTGAVESTRSGDSEALWFLAPEALAAVRWHNGEATRLGLGLTPEAPGCAGCSLEFVGMRYIVPGPAGGAVVVRNFADRSRVHRYCEVVRLSPTEVLARDVFHGFGAPVRTLGSPMVMVSGKASTALLLLGETGWLSRELTGAGSYEGWVETDDTLYRIDQGALVRADLSETGGGPTTPSPRGRPLAIAPARGGGLWALTQDASAGGEASRPSRVLERLARTGQTSTSPVLPTAFACQPGAPEELADGRIAVPCRAWDGAVTTVIVLVNGQWQQLRSAKTESIRANVDRLVARRHVARTFAPWLNNTSPMVLVFVHLLFLFGLRLSRGGAATDTPSSRGLGPLAALIGAAVGLLFGFFEQLGSGWWRNDSLFPSFSREEWWLAKLTAAAAGAYVGVLLSRRGVRPRLWRFLAASALVPVLSALSMVLGWTLLEGTSGALLVGGAAFGYGFISSPRDSEENP